MTITDERSTFPAPASPPPSYVRRHPILAGFGVLSGLSLFSALWPLSAIVVAIAVAGHATGLDRAAWTVAVKLADRVSRAAGRHPAVPAPEPVAPPSPEPPAPAPSAPRREAHPPAVPEARSHRNPRAHAPSAPRPVRSRRPKTAEPRVGAGMDGPGS